MSIVFLTWVGWNYYNAPQDLKRLSLIIIIGVKKKCIWKQHYADFYHSTHMSCANTERDYSKRSQITSIDEQPSRIEKQNSATAENQLERKQYLHSRSSSSNIEKVSFYFPLSYFLLTLKPLQIWNIISIPTLYQFYTFMLTNDRHAFSCLYCRKIQQNQLPDYSDYQSRDLKTLTQRYVSLTDRFLQPIRTNVHYAKIRCTRNSEKKQLYVVKSNYNQRFKVKAHGGGKTIPIQPKRYLNSNIH